MCGITGLLTLKPAARDALNGTVQSMMATIHHRGPDDAGSWVDETSGVALGFRRLAIVDLSAEGHQPMMSADERYVMVFNGETYNFLPLREELLAKGHRFHGHSDTEVMLTAFVEWGIESSITRFNGMCAFAVWDRQERALYLCRDRIGKKPLYYGWAGQSFVFGSELKSLRAHPELTASIDEKAVAAFMRYGYVPGPLSIYKGIAKLPPAVLLKLDVRSGREPILKRYWSAHEVALRGIAHPFRGDESEAIGELDAILRDAVRMRMIADVPLGAFLSGGIDSSTIVSLMQAQSSRPVKTFSIGFEEDSYNEARFAAAVARHLGTSHTELYVTSGEALGVIPRLPEMYDEPFADSSQIPTFLVSQLARRSVTVSLSGDGGDELFGGYNRYFWGNRIWRRLRWMPVGLRSALAAGVTAVSPERWSSAFETFGRVLPRSLRQPNAGDKLHKLAEVVAVRSPEQMYSRLTSHWKGANPVLDPDMAMTGVRGNEDWVDLTSFTESMMYLDLVTYLPDDILVKLDRATMAVSLEGRAPFLDHRVVEFAWSLPISMKIRGGEGKWIVRRLLDGYVPAALTERPKMGFGVPIDRWLRGPLRSWAEDLLDETRLKREGFLDPAAVRRRWNEHVSGRRSWQYDLWNVLMFESWLEAARSPAADLVEQTAARA